jgi:TolB protein
MNLKGNRKDEKLSLRPSYFQAPAWAPDGSAFLVAAETEEGEEALLLADRGGSIQKKLASISGEIAFSWSPDSQRIAYVTQSLDKEGQGGETRLLTVLQVDGSGEPISVTDELVMAFFWSPDGRKLAYFIPTLVSVPDEASQETGEPIVVLSLNILDVVSGKSIEIHQFFPTQQFVNILPYFDQYQHSTTLWSPDSRKLVIGALYEDQESGIYMIEASGKLVPRFLTEGEVGFWSWR